MPPAPGATTMCGHFSAAKGYALVGRGPQRSRARNRADVHHHALRAARRAQGTGQEAAGRRAQADRGDPGRPHRARGPDGHVPPAARPARRGRERAVLRPARIQRRGQELHRPARHACRQRELRPAADGLAGRRGSSVLPGHGRVARPGQGPAAHQDQGQDGPAARRRDTRPGRRRPVPARGRDRRVRPARRAQRQPHRPDAGHRGDHPGRAGSHHQVPDAWRARRPGRPRHRQDRRRAAPGRLPAVHVPAAAGKARRSRRRPERHLPAVHRPGAAVPGRDQRAAGHRR